MSKQQAPTERVFKAAEQCGRPCIVITHDGDEADMLVQGEPEQVGQLVDALLRRLGLVEGAAA